MEEIIGTQVRSGANLVDTQSVLQSGAEFYGIYFGAHWAPPCRLFTPALAEFYNKVNNNCETDNRRVEMVFCSIDGNNDAFERNFKDMPFKAIPYTEEQRIQNLKQKFSINGIPTLVILDRQGEVVSYEGRTDIQNHQEGAVEVW
jgi:nucleoredoxin